MKLQSQKEKKQITGLKIEPLKRYLQKPREEFYSVYSYRSSPQDEQQTTSPYLNNENSTKELNKIKNSFLGSTWKSTNTQSKLNHVKGEIEAMNIKLWCELRRWRGRREKRLNLTLVWLWKEEYAKGVARNLEREWIKHRFFWKSSTRQDACCVYFIFTMFYFFA